MINIVGSFVWLFQGYIDRWIFGFARLNMVYCALLWCKEYLNSTKGRALVMCPLEGTSMEEISLARI